MRPRSSKSRWKSSTNGSAAESAPPCFAHQRLTTRPFYCVWKPAFGWARSAPCAGRMSILPAACCIFDAQPIESTTAGAPELVTQTPKTDNSLQTIPLTAKMLPYCVPSGRAKMITCLPAVTSPEETENAAIPFSEILEGTGHFFQKFSHTASFLCDAVH